jgi:hypothetical protein
VAVVILHAHKYGKRKVTRKFKLGGLHERHAVATWKPSQHSLLDTGKPRKTCVEVTGPGPSGYGLLASNPVTKVLSGMLSHRSTT